MSRSLIQRISPFFLARIKQNHKLLRSSFYYSSPSSSSALHEASSESLSPSLDAIHMTDNCVKRTKELQASEESSEEKMLRLSVETGGCSGFQYVFDLDDKTNPDDRVFEKEGVKLVVDNISYDFVKGATINYIEELIRSAFLMNGPSYQLLLKKEKAHDMDVNSVQWCPGEKHLLASASDDGTIRIWELETLP